MKTKYHVKKGDKVVVNSGVWKGEKATVAAVLKKKDRVVLEISDMTPEKQQRIGRRVKKTSENPKGVLIERAVSVHVSNVNKADEEQDS
jgi:large subunit ribosomal protein L24